MTTADLSARPADTPTAALQLVVATGDGLVVDGRAVLPGCDVVELAVGAGGRLAALTACGAVHVGDDRAWTRLATIEDGRARVLAWHGDGLLVGGAEARLWHVSRHGDVDRIGSFDRAPTHAEWHTPWGGPPDVFSIASDGSSCFVNVHVGGILRTSDLRTWVPTIDLHQDVHDVALDGRGRLWAATGAGGLACSDDRGRTWTHLTDGLHATYARAVAPVDGAPLVSVSSGPFGRDGAIYRLDGDVLTRITTLPALDGSIDRGRLVTVDGHVAVALPAGEVVVSSDGGRTWDTVLAGGGDIRALALRRVATG